MGFEKQVFRAEYRSLLVDVVQSFYIPLLSRSVLYQRAVGYFASTALIKLSIGIAELVRNGGRIQLLVSPYLQPEDLEAIRYGYHTRDKVIEQAIMRQFREPVTYFEAQRLNLLATLIALGRLDIKIVFTQSSDDIGMYHEKIGLAYDSDGNIVAFTGSMNESQAAFVSNYESIDVFCSWTADRERVMLKVAAFDALWNDRDPSVRTVDFPKVAYEKLQSYQTKEVDFDVDRKEFFSQRGAKQMTIVGPRIPDEVKLYDYQIRAIQSWAEHGYRGIFDMATGTGKTYTALAAISRLYEDVGGRLAVIIICPYQHLVEQWVNEIVMFNMNPIIGYSKSRQKDWKKRLRYTVAAYQQKVVDYFCFVTTNATFASAFVQDLIASIEDNIVLVVDEAHNFGAPMLRKALKDTIPFRLALSATLERHMDQDGTRALYGYFGEKCVEYPLERAIREEKLTPYFYYPVPVFLTESEWDEYRRLSKQIGKFVKRDDGAAISNSTVKMLLIRRALLLSAAENKLHQLESVIRGYRHERHLLVYCGVAVLDDPEVDDKEIKQIDAVVQLLGNRLKMRVAKFTATESPDERAQLIKEFTDGDHLQALVAMRCLDEGVNIPAVHMAFMLASSTNPKEYIQRRGRVLRKSKGKTHAIIYDFVTLPRPLDEVGNLSDEELRYDISLVKREMERMKEFVSIAENPSDTDRLIGQIETSYRLNLLGGHNDDFAEWQ